MSFRIEDWLPSFRLLAGSVVVLAVVQIFWTIYRRRKSRREPKNQLEAWLYSLCFYIEAFVAFSAVKIFWTINRRQKSNTEYKDGVVYLHIFPRNFTKKVVNLSPYAIKVETWCRMFKVPYQVVETDKFSPKEKHIPWIVYNGEVQADSSLIIELLQGMFNCHDNLSDLEKGFTRTITRMMDDAFAGLYFYYRFSIKTDEYHRYFRMTTIPKFVQYYVLEVLGKKVKRRSEMNGFARYGVDHVIKLGEQDLQALENILGDKQYLFGDTPTTVDATVFGHLAQILYPDLSYPWKEYIAADCPRLLDYCTRIKDKFWPDWDSLVEHDTFE